MRKIFDGRRSGGAVIDEGDGLGRVVESDWHVGQTGRGRGSNGRPGRIGNGTSRNAAGISRRGGRVGDDWVSVGVRESLGRQNQGKRCRGKPQIGCSEWC